MKHERCPETILTPRFASPNSRLPQERLEELQECIEAANRLLRTLGSPRDEENLTQLRLHFLTLRGVLVKIEVECNGAGEDPDRYETINLIGTLVTSGRDFIQLTAFGEQQFIKFEKICSLQYEGSPKERMPAQELHCIDPCLRKQLVFRFGEAVAGNPALLNLFFGIPLHIQLLDFLGCKIAIRLEGDASSTRGILVDSQEGHVRMTVGKEKECVDFKFNEICVITVLSKD